MTACSICGSGETGCHECSMCGRLSCEKCEVVDPREHTWELDHAAICLTCLGHYDTTIRARRDVLLGELEKLDEEFMLLCYPELVSLPGQRELF